MSSVKVWARCGATIALVVGYAVLAHYTNTAPGRETLGLSVALAPVLLAVLSMAWRSPHRMRALALFGLTGGALLAVWTSMEHHYSHIYWLEHAGSQLFLCVMFMRTLAPGREPMCSYFARKVHGTLGPELERYTRKVTVAWVAFFGLMSTISTVLFVAAPLASWSFFANFLTAPLIGMMFVVEYAVRRLVHPDMDHAHILAAVKAAWNGPARP